MKTLINTIIVLSIIFCCSAAEAQGWFIQTTLNPAQTLQVIRFYNNSTGYTTSSLFNGSNNCIYKTTNGGVNWTAQNSGFTSWRFMAIYIFHPDTVLISGNGGIILKTVNGGTNWVTTNTNGVTDQIWGLEFTSRQVGYACGSAGRMMKTTDGGNNWFNLTSGTPYQLWSLKFLNDNTGYVSGSSLIYKTTNAGASWFDTGFQGLPPGDFLRQILFTDPNTAYVISDIGRIRKTTNAGANWTMLSTNTTESVFGIDFTNANSGYAACDHGLIIKTTDGGQSWAPQASGLNEGLYSIDFTSIDTGYICTWSGKILKTTNGGVTFVSEIGTDVPEKFSLGQNYPNPFNPSTKIKFDIAPPLSTRGAPLPMAGGETEGVKITVYDALGKEAALLVNENLHPGTYEVNWNASAYPSGIYFYKLTAGDYTETKKMILLK